MAQIDKIKGEGLVAVNITLSVKDLYRLESLLHTAEFVRQFISASSETNAMAYCSKGLAYYVDEKTCKDIEMPIDTIARDMKNLQAMLKNFGVVRPEEEGMDLFKE